MIGKFPDINALKSALGCEKWPQRWEKIYPDVLRDFQKNGCKYATPEAYDEIQQKYGILTEYIDVYKNAAREVAKSEPLSLFLALLCKVLADRENAPREMGFEMPKYEGECCLAVDMLPALAMASTLDYSYAKMKARGIPDEIAFKTLQMPTNSIRRYMERYNGHYGFDLMAWFQLSIDCKLYRLGRLEIEVEHKFNAGATVFRNAEGKVIILAHNKLLHKTGNPLGTVGFEDEEGSWTAVVTEDEKGWTGYPYAETGYVRSTPVTLLKSEWKMVMQDGDNVIGLHIPTGGGMTPEAVDDTIRQGIDFVKKYYPDYDYKAFHCHSWLCDPQLSEVLGEDSNIAKFAGRFYKIAFKSDGKGVFYHAFAKNRDEVKDVSQLPETTSLWRKLKKHYMSGKCIYEVQGIFFANDML